MCLAIPALIKSINGYQAEVDIEGVSREVSIQLTPEVKVGDYVLLHTGYAISIVDEAEALGQVEIGLQVIILNRAIVKGSGEGRPSALVQHLRVF